MSANTRMATATHVLCVLALSPPSGSTAVLVARSLDTNPVVVRVLLKSLAQGGLVEMKPGRNGGVRLAKPATDITLDAVHRTVGDTVFAHRSGGNPRCPVNRTLPGLLGPVFAAADDAVARTLAATTVAQLAARLPPNLPA